MPNSWSETEGNIKQPACAAAAQLYWLTPQPADGFRCNQICAEMPPMEPGDQTHPISIHPPPCRKSRDTATGRGVLWWKPIGHLEEIASARC